MTHKISESFKELYFLDVTTIEMEKLTKKSWLWFYSLWPNILRSDRMCFRDPRSSTLVCNPYVLLLKYISKIYNRWISGFFWSFEKSCLFGRLFVPIRHLFITYLHTWTQTSTTLPHILYLNLRVSRKSI